MEPGNATPAQAPGWVKMRRALTGDIGVIYVNRANVTAVFNAMGAAGLTVVRDFRLGIATLDGVTKTVPDMTGVVFVQWKPATATSGPGHFDESVIYDDSWHPTGPPPHLVSVKATATFSDGSSKSWTVP